MRTNNPAIDPANNDSLVGAIRFAYDKLLQRVDGMLPARVIKYERATNRVQVQLLIAIVTTDGAQVSRPQIASLPVLLLGGGGFMLNFPLNEGDLGWVIANDRDISLFLQSYTESKPNTSRIKNFSDGLFIPDAMRNFTINEEDEEHAVFQNLSGTIRISLWPNQVKITAPTTLIDGNLVVTGTITGQNGIGVSGGENDSGVITGNFSVIGNITATGNITPNVPP